MATVTKLVDDLDNSIDAVETVTFALDGVTFEIDLAEANAEKLRGALAVFVERARRTGGRVQRGRPAGVGAAVPKVARTAAELATSKAYSRAVREWARANGFTVPDRGRLSAAVLEAYANRDSENSKVIMKEKVDDTSVVDGGTVTALKPVRRNVKPAQTRSTSRRPAPESK